MPPYLFQFVAVAVPQSRTRTEPTALIILSVLTEFISAVPSERILTWLSNSLPLITPKFSCVPMGIATRLSSIGRSTPPIEIALISESNSSWEIGVYHSSEPCSFFLIDWPDCASVKPFKEICPNPSIIIDWLSTSTLIKLLLIQFNSFQGVVPFPILSLPVSNSKPGSPASRMGLTLAQAAALPLLNLNIVLYVTSATFYPPLRVNHTTIIYYCI